MASAPNDPGTVKGRVDANGRLIAADPPLALLQAEAGSAIGARLALPQIAAVARLARELNVPVSRSVIAAGETRDYDLWVRATLDGADVQLEIEGWRPRQPAAPRLDLVLAVEEEVTVADDLATGEWATDAELKLTLLAPGLAQRLGIEQAEAIGQPLTRLFKLDEDEDGTLPLLAGLAARAAFSDQAATARTGDSIKLHLSAEVVKDDTGGFLGFAGHALSLSPALTLVTPAPPAFGGGLNDELDRALRSPLDRIIAAADKIVDRSDGPLRSDYASYAGDIAAAGRHLLSVIRAMSDGVAASQTVDLAACVKEAIGLLASVASAKQVTLDLSDAAPAALARGEQRGVVQILVNIIGNAIRHSPAGGTVTIGLAEADARASVSVVDRGPGIAPADQQRIFERFERLGSSEADGTGLGLAIARRLARSMNGDIVLESVPGEGARFTLDLPRA